MSASNGLRAGAAQVDITPDQGALLSGGVGRHEPAESVIDPLYAKAVVLESGSGPQGRRKACILSLEVTLLDRPVTQAVRDAVSARCGIDRDAILVTATQTHSAPAAGMNLFEGVFPIPDGFDFLRHRDARFTAMATERAIAACIAANDALRPARIGWQSARLDGIAFSRRGIRNDGTVGMPWTYTTDSRPLGQTEYRYLEGPTDPEVGVAWIQDESMRTIAHLLHFTCHPVNVYYWRGRGHHGEVSADWPGAWVGELGLNGDAVGLVLNGCCGNINPWPCFTPDFVPDHLRMGRELAAISREALARVSFTGDVALDWRRIELALPIREIEPKVLMDARARIDAHPEPEINAQGLVDMGWYYAAMYMALDAMRRRSGTLPYEVQAFRVGDLAIVALPGEPFVEGQLAIKIASPAVQTIVSHMANHYVGYVPTRDAFSRGGHECNPSLWSRHEPGALDGIVEAAGGLLREMWA